MRDMYEGAETVWKYMMLIIYKWIKDEIYSIYEIFTHIYWWYHTLYNRPYIISVWLNLFSSLCSVEKVSIFACDFVDIVSVPQPSTNKRPNITHWKHC